VPGVVCDPVRNDMVTAVRDGGAPLNGRPIAVSANHQLRSSLLRNAGSNLTTNDLRRHRASNQRKADILATNGHLHDDMPAQFNEGRGAYHSGAR
jgi:fructose-1,6-bisphosphatase/inositol monophosphatase family enzyme